MNTEKRLPSPFSPAYKSIRAVIIFLAVGAAGIAADLLSKHHVFAALMDLPEKHITVIAGFVNLTLSTNPGIVFGILVPGWVVASVTLVAMVSVVMLFAMSSRRQWGLHTALGMVLAGAAGNAYDRLFSRVTFPGESVSRVGHVRDFIDVHLGQYHWPTFNVADILLVVGVGLIMLHMIRQRHR